MFASDNQDVLEYLVHHDNEPELQMISVADESKIHRSRAYGEYEARKERLRKVSSLPLKRNRSVRVLVTKFAMRICRMERRQISNGGSNENAESNGLF